MTEISGGISTDVFVVQKTLLVPQEKTGFGSGEWK
jgi:hypothetical protein